MWFGWFGWFGWFDVDFYGGYALGGWVIVKKIVEKKCQPCGLGDSGDLGDLICDCKKIVAVI